MGETPDREQRARAGKGQQERHRQGQTDVVVTKKIEFCGQDTCSTNSTEGATLKLYWYLS